MGKSVETPPLPPRPDGGNAWPCALCVLPVGRLHASCRHRDALSSVFHLASVKKQGRSLQTHNAIIAPKKTVPLLQLSVRTEIQPSVTCRSAHWSLYGLFTQSSFWMKSFTCKLWFVYAFLHDADGPGPSSWATPTSCTGPLPPGTIQLVLTPPCSVNRKSGVSPS